MSLKNLYHNLFSDLDLEHPDRFYGDFDLNGLTLPITVITLENEGLHARSLLKLP